jgi:hypothetical protein
MTRNRRSRRGRYAASSPSRRRGPPSWYEEDTSPCDCPEDERETTEIRSTTGYSDFFYGKVRCEECGATWCYWIEG